MFFLNAIFTNISPPVTEQIHFRAKHVYTVCTTYISNLNICFLPKDLDALLEKDKTLEEESKNLSELLSKQKEKYALLQVKGHLMMMTKGFAFSEKLWITMEWITKFNCNSPLQKCEGTGASFLY